MRFTFFTIFNSLFSFQVCADFNLVKNHSFEKMLKCPSLTNQLHPDFIEDWDSSHSEIITVENKVLRNQQNEIIKHCQPPVNGSGFNIDIYAPDLQMGSILGGGLGYPTQEPFDLSIDSQTNIATSGNFIGLYYKYRNTQEFPRSEYAFGTLKDSLKKAIEYDVEYWVSLFKSGPHSNGISGHVDHGQVAFKKFGAYFYSPGDDDDRGLFLGDVYGANEGLDPYYFWTNSGNMIESALNQGGYGVEDWEKVSMKFVAPTEGINRLAIGHFHNYGYENFPSSPIAPNMPIESVDFVKLINGDYENGDDIRVYYFLDNVSVGCQAKKLEYEVIRNQNVIEIDGTEQFCPNFSFNVIKDNISEYNWEIDVYDLEDGSLNEIVLGHESDNNNEILHNLFEELGESPYGKEYRVTLKGWCHRGQTISSEALIAEKVVNFTIPKQPNYVLTYQSKNIDENGDQVFNPGSSLYVQPYHEFATVQLISPDGTMTETTGAPFSKELEQPGKYKVEIKYDDPDMNCPVIITRQFTLRSNAYLPNVISPNGSGPQINKVFKPQHNPNFPAFSSYKIRIFNRWGGLEFKAVDIPWSGYTNKGEKMASGAYLYIVDFTLVEEGRIITFSESHDVNLIW